MELIQNLSEIFINVAQAAEGTGAPTGQTAPGGTFGMFLPMLLVFAIFYFLLIRPQSKQRKLHQQLVQGLKKGDDVVTASGIHGKVTGVTDSIATLEIAENVRIKIEKQQVQTVKQNSPK